VIQIFGALSGQHPLFYLAVYAPAIAAIVVVLLREGRSGLRRFLARLLIWRSSIGWYALMFIGIPLVFYAAAALAAQILSHLGEPDSRHHLGNPASSSFSAKRHAAECPGIHFVLCRHCGYQRHRDPDVQPVVRQHLTSGLVSLPIDQSAPAGCITSRQPPVCAGFCFDGLLQAKNHVYEGGCRHPSCSQG
jgi:hypothetical protein